VHIAILTFDGYNELDSLIALGVLNRIKRPDWRVSIATPAPTVRSMNGVVIESMASLEDACAADAVIVGSGTRTREVIADPAVMGQLRQLDPSRQLLAGQCSGTLVLAKLGLLEDVPACTDLITKPWVVEAGIDVLNCPSSPRTTSRRPAAAWHRIISPRGSSRGSRAVKRPRVRCTTSHRWERRKSTSPAPCAISRLTCHNRSPSARRHGRPTSPERYPRFAAGCAGRSADTLARGVRDDPRFRVTGAVGKDGRPLKTRTSRLFRTSRPVRPSHCLWRKAGGRRPVTGR
jgi:putative intracellular protease/amidase